MIRVAIALLFLFLVPPLHAQQASSPEQVMYVRSLDVDLDAMTKRPSGLYVLSLDHGNGLLAVPGDRLEVHYTVWLPDGRKVDSSYDRGEPLSITLGRTGLIDGFTEGVTHMAVGERRRLVVPYQLGYGKKGQSPGIPQYATLVFEILLVSNEGS